MQGVAVLPGGGGAAAPPGATLHPAPAAPQPVPPGCIRAALLNRRNLAELFVGRSEMAALRQLELALREMRTERGEPHVSPLLGAIVRLKSKGTYRLARITGVRTLDDGCGGVAMTLRVEPPVPAPLLLYGESFILPSMLSDRNTLEQGPAYEQCGRQERKAFEEGLGHQGWDLAETAAAAWRLKVARAWAPHLQPWLAEFGQAKLLRDLEQPHPEQLGFLEHADLPADHVGALLPAAQQQQQQLQMPPPQQQPMRTPPQQQVPPPQQQQMLLVPQQAQLPQAQRQEAQQQQPQAQLRPAQAHLGQQVVLPQQWAVQQAPAQQYAQQGTQTLGQNVIDLTRSVSPPATLPHAAAAAGGPASCQQMLQAQLQAQPQLPQLQQQQAAVQQQLQQPHPLAQALNPLQLPAAQPKTPLQLAMQPLPQMPRTQAPQAAAAGQAVKSTPPAGLPLCKQVQQAQQQQTPQVQGQSLATPAQQAQQQQPPQALVASQPKQPTAAGQQAAKRACVLPEETLALFMRALSKLLKDGCRPVTICKLAACMNNMSRQRWSAQAVLSMKFIDVCHQAVEDMWAKGEGGLRVVWDDSWNSWVVKPSQRRLQRILSDPLPPLPPSMRQQGQQQAQQAQQAQQQTQQAQQVQQQAQQQLEQQAQQQQVQQAQQQQEAEKAKVLEQQLQAEREKKARDDAADAAAMAKQLALLRQPPPGARLAADMAAPRAELSFEESRWWCHQAKASSEEPATQPPTVEPAAAGSAAPTSGASVQAPSCSVPEAVALQGVVQQAQAQQPALEAVEQRVETQQEVPAPAQAPQQPPAQQQAQAQLPHQLQVQVATKPQAQQPPAQEQQQAQPQQQAQAPQPAQVQAPPSQQQQQQEPAHEQAQSQPSLQQQPLPQQTQAQQQQQLPPPPPQQQQQQHARQHQQSQPQQQGQVQLQPQPSRQQQQALPPQPQAQQHQQHQQRRTERQQAQQQQQQQAPRQHSSLAVGGAPPTCCALCRLGPEANEPLGPLRQFDVSTSKQRRTAMVHDLCAAYAAQTEWVGIKPGAQHGLIRVPEEVRRARLLRCSQCGRTGAAMGCDVAACECTYHLPCAMLQAGAALDPDRTRVYCPLHAGRFQPHAPEAKSQRNLQHCRRVMQRLVRKGAVDLPVAAPAAAGGPAAAAPAGGQAAAAAAAAQQLAVEATRGTKRPAEQPAAPDHGRAKQAK